MSLAVKIDEQQNKFYAFVEGKECVLNFRVADEGIMDYYRTFVPPELRGRGLASELVEYALNYAREHNQKILPTCSFVREYIDDHPEWSNIASNSVR